MESREDRLQRLDELSLELLIEECCRFKANVIEQDEKESSLRRILNYGHTFGHAIESASDLRWTHGQAVAAGMMFASVLAYKLGLAQSDIIRRQANLLSKAGLLTVIPSLNEADVFAALRQDKKRSGGKITFVIIQAPGKTRVIEVEENIIKETIKDYSKIYDEAMSQ
jgi:3-dehydroquinate synthase